MALEKSSLNTWLSALMCLYLAAAVDKQTSKSKSVYVAVVKCRGPAGIDGEDNTRQSKSQVSWAAARENCLVVVTESVLSFSNFKKKTPFFIGPILPNTNSKWLLR